MNALDTTAGFTRRTVVRAVCALSIAAGATAQGSWTQLAPATSPTATWGASLAYDSARQRVVHFGGRFSVGTWEFDGSNWTQIPTSNAPSQRYQCGLVYHSARQVIVLFGGFDVGANQASAETWEYDGTNWTQILTPASPPGRTTRLVYDSARQRVILIGGSGGGTRFTDSWEYDGATWVQTAPIGSFTNALQQATVYDPSSQRVWTYGGLTVPGAVSGDMWEYNPALATWTQVTLSAPNPAGRRLLQGVWDATSGRVLIHGGDRFTSVLDDTWEFNPVTRTWAEVVGAGGPRVQDYGLAFDSARGATILFGGLSNNMSVDGTWEFQGPTLGTRFCNPAVANSTGVPAEVSLIGSAVVATNSLAVQASFMPHNSFGYFLTSRTQGSVVMPGGSQGTLCLGGSIGRYVGPGQIQNSGAAGSISLALDLTAMPTPTGPVGAVAGETWNFQAWYRDANPTVTSNFTDGIGLMFL